MLFTREARIEASCAAWIGSRSAAAPWVSWVSQGRETVVPAYQHA